MFRKFRRGIMKKVDVLVKTDEQKRIEERVSA
jgi:hypothetical protein